MNAEILKQLTRIADALELAILPQNNTAYADKVKETLNVDDAEQELAPKSEAVSITYWVDKEYKSFGFVEGNELESYSDSIPSSFRICTEREYTKFTKRFSGYPLLLSEYITKIEPEQSEKEYTHDELKKLCLSKSREDVANKPKLKCLLKSYGAVKANDVKQSDLAEIIAKINSGEF